MHPLKLVLAMAGIVFVAVQQAQADDPCKAAKGFLDAGQIANCLVDTSKGIKVGSSADVGVGLPAVTFEFGSAELTPGGRTQLDEVAKALSFEQLKARHMTIEGHTDAVGDEDYNKKLSERRADAVLIYLGQSGLDTHRMATVGYGESRLRPDSDPTADVQRRVEIELGSAP